MTLLVFIPMGCLVIKDDFVATAVLHDDEVEVKRCTYYNCCCLLYFLSLNFALSGFTIMTPS
jgi:hypothetical protein